MYIYCIVLSVPLWDEWRNGAAWRPDPYTKHTSLKYNILYLSSPDHGYIKLLIGIVGVWAGNSGKRVECWILHSPYTQIPLL